ncbi:hypothetical protein ACEQ8H_000508 [Pleosporales sp. CAS-2024a]
MPGGIHAPLQVILTWPPPNHVDPERRPKTILLTACIMGPLTVGLLLARLWVRIFHQRNTGWDDWFMLAATIPTIALTILIPLAVTQGLDRHIWDFDFFKDASRLVRTRKYILAIECVFCVTSAMIKISILLFYRRLSSRVVSNAFRWTTWTTIVFIVAYSIALTLAPILGCQPLSAFWDQMDANKVLAGYKYHCFDEGADVVAAGIISAAQDLLTAILPSFLYWNLQISKQQKFSLFGVFAIGYGAVALGALRAYYSYYIFYETYDVTWATYDAFFMTLLELHVGAFCANAPTLKVFFKHFFHDKLVSATTSWKKSNTRVDSAHSPSSKTAGSINKIVGRLAGLFGVSYAQSGYISGTDTAVSVDAHGGVQVHKDIDLIRYPALALKPAPKHASLNTLNMLNAHYYTDMELGHGALQDDDAASLPSSSRTSRIFQAEEDPGALPPMPSSPASMLSQKSSKNWFAVRAQGQRSPIIPDLPESPEPAGFPSLRSLDEHGNAESATTSAPIPMPSLYEKRAEWQSRS